MKPIKILGLTALAALLAMAFVGVSSAMAGSTLLCHEDEVPCPAPAPASAASGAFTHVHETSVGKATLLGSSNPECDVLFLGDVIGHLNEETEETEYLGSPLQILGTFTYSNCNGECTAKEENGPTEIQVLRTGSELAKVTSGAGEFAGLVKLVCTVFKISCKYVGTGLEGHALEAVSKPLGEGLDIAPPNISR